MDTIAQAPGEVVWDLVTLSDVTTDVSLAISRTADPAVVETRTDDCPPGPDLVVPVRISVDLGQGGVVFGAADRAVEGCDEPGTMRITAAGPATLINPWLDLAERHLREIGYSSTYEWLVTMPGHHEWPTSALSIQARDDNKRTLLWSGTLSE
jgi:hypothetical protein